jgi:Family of unknown function (DUF5995)
MLKSTCMSSSNMVLPTTIDEVITHLDSIVLACEASGSRAGYFPAMYNRVTRRVKERIMAGTFDDAPRMERFDVIFANRYLAAYYDYAQDRSCSESWKITFEASKKWSPMVIQHLIASMNAHICLDLGIAAAETETQNLPSLKNDFDQVNDILDSLIDEVEAELREIFHPLVTFDKLTGNAYWRVAHVGIVKARSDAWRVAEAYVDLQSETERQAFIKARDEQVAEAGNRVLWPPMLVKLMVVQLRVFEKGNVASKVRILNRRPVESGLL